MRDRLRARLLRGTVACVWALAVLLSMRSAIGAPGEYDIDQRFATISFATRVFGLLHSEGRFLHFQGHLSIDFADPRATTIAVTVDDEAIDMTFPGGAGLLRSEAYFDSTHYPTIIFRSTAVEPGLAGHYTVRGLLTIRGVTRDETLDVVLGHGAGGNPATMDFVASGIIHRSDFGMVAGSTVISNTIVLTIHANVQPPSGG
jgi:polyisoprenoid-binding protein YceI